MAAYGKAPLTVECWAKLNGAHGFNILVANEPKVSGTHWEIYSYVSTGNFSVYLPGYTPSEIKSAKNITDGKWHYLAMVFDGKIVRLYVDAVMVRKQQVIRRAAIASKPGALLVGAMVEKSDLEQFKKAFCGGVIDDLRISAAPRSIKGVPNAPLKVDSTTVALWNFDKSAKVDGRSAFANLAANKNPLMVTDLSGLSLDDIDRKSFKAGPAPMDARGDIVRLKKGAAVHPVGVAVVSLCGTWKMAEGGDEKQRLAGQWKDAIDARDEDCRRQGRCHQLRQGAGRCR